ncbi:MAG: DinB family protein [Pyrinomonadaceae bacterium]
MEFNTIEEIFAAIDKTRGKLVNTAAVLTENDANFQSAPEKWSAAHLVEHLAKTEESLLTLIEKLLAKAEAENVPATGRIEPPVSFAEIAEKAKGQKFTAPDAIKPEGASTITNSLARLEKSRASLKALQPRLEKVDLSNAKFPHPAFGPLNLYYWLAFIGLHEARHLAQISNCLEALPKN